MLSRCGVEPDASGLEDSHQASRCLLARLLRKGSQALGPGKRWVNWLFKKGPIDQDVDDAIEELDPLSKFAPVLANVDFAKLQQFASSVRQSQVSPNQYDATPWSFECVDVLSPLYGSFHILFPLVFGDGVKWLAKIPSAGHEGSWSDMAARALTTEALTMRLLRKRGMPIPEVYEFMSSANNVVGCPFIFMEFLAGRPLYEGWYNGSGPDGTLETFRQQCLRSLASLSKEMSTLTFSQAGCLVYDSDGNIRSIEASLTVNYPAMHKNLMGYYAGTEELNIGEFLCEAGPFDNEKGFLLSLFDQNPPSTTSYEEGQNQILRLFVDWILCDNVEKPFVLCHPDLDLQNILVDNEGNVVGLIDWDGVATVPRSVGCAYPKWITRDWNPYDYNYPDRGYGRREQPPQELNHYRQVYTGFLEELSTGEHENAVARSFVSTVRKSLLVEKLDLAVKNPQMGDEIFDKIFRLVAQVSGQANFRLELEPGTELIREPFPLSVGNSTSGNPSTNEHITSSTSASTESDTTVNDASSSTRESTPQTDISSKTSQESIDQRPKLRADPAVAPTTTFENHVITEVPTASVSRKTYKQTEYCSKESKRARMSSVLSKLSKAWSFSHSSNTKSQNQGTNELRIPVVATVSEIVDTQQTAPHSQVQDTSIEIIPSTAGDVISYDHFPGTDREQSTSTGASKEGTVPTSLSPYGGSCTQTVDPSPTAGLPVPRILDVTGDRPKYLSPPSKSAREVKHRVRVGVPEEDVDPDVITSNKNAQSHPTSSLVDQASEPRDRRRLQKKQKLPSCSKTPLREDPEETPSTRISRKRSVTAWLKSSIPKPSFKSREVDWYKNIPVSPPQQSSSASNTEDDSIHSDRDAPLGPQKIDLDKLEFIDDDQLEDEGFSPITVCEDIAEGKLDDGRMQRLKFGFQVLLNSL